MLAVFLRGGKKTRKPRGFWCGRIYTPTAHRLRVRCSASNSRCSDRSHRFTSPKKRLRRLAAPVQLAASAACSSGAKSVSRIPASVWGSARRGGPKPP